MIPTLFNITAGSNTVSKGIKDFVNILGVVKVLSFVTNRLYYKFINNKIRKLKNMIYI